MSSNVTDLRDHVRQRRIRELTAQADSIRVYHHLLREDSVSLEALTRALRGTGLSVRTDPTTGADIIQIDPHPRKPAA